MVELVLDDRLPDIDYGRHPAYGMEPDPELGRQAVEILNPLVEEMRQREQYRSEHFGFRYGHDSEAGERLVRDGSLQLQLSDPATAAIVQGAAGAIDLVKARIGVLQAEGKVPRFSDRLELIDRDTSPDLWLAVHQGLKQVGAYELTRTFFGATGVTLKQMAALVSTPDDSETSIRPGEEGRLPTAGMHVDSSGRCILKIVLYLSQVGPGDGPFCFVPTSHRWSPSSEDRMYRRAFDKSPLSARTRASRRMFISLPKPMQVKAEFGGDLLRESEDGQRLLAAEIAALGPPGLLSLFDPEAVHRGGLATTGERQALLITLIARYD